MKKIVAVLLTTALLLAMCAVCVSAEEVTYSLVAKDADWMAEFNACDSPSTQINAVYGDDGSVTLTTDVAGWPCTDVHLAEDDYVTVDVEGAKFVWDFEVKNQGGTFIYIKAMDAAGAAVYFSLTNDVMGTAAMTTDANGNLPVGSYSGEIAVSELLEATITKGGDLNNAVVNGKITFIGLQAFVVSGAEVVINNLDIVAPAPAADDTTTDDATTEDTTTEDTTPATGDNGIIVFAVLGVVAIAGAAVAIKSRH